MKPEELEALIESYAEELTEEELEAITKASEEAEASNCEEDVPTSNLMVKFLSEVVQGIRSIAERVQDADPLMECYRRFTRALDDVLLQYIELHKSRQQSARQLSTTQFFQPCPSTSTPLAPSPASPASDDISSTLLFGSSQDEPFYGF